MLNKLTAIVVSLGVCLVTATAVAGPVEQLEALSISPVNAAHMVVPYRYGGGGMFVSQDGGKTFGWLCSAGVATSSVNRNGRVQFGGDGQIYIGLFDGILRGAADGCGFTPVPEMAKKYVADITTDPIDPKRTYAITTTAMAENGIFMNDGSGTFAPFGSTIKQFLDRLFVVKTPEGRRFYETSVLTDAATNEVQYFVRVSNDDAKTWTDTPYDLAQFGPMDKFADFSLVAVNPQDPNHVVGRVTRNQAVDTLVFSTEQGKAGSWQLLAEPTQAEAVTFTPDGVLYFGDSDQTTKGLFVVDKVGAAPRKLSDKWKVLCLGWDTANKRLLGCSNFFLFGEVDTTSGDLKPLLDLRCAEKFVECPGQMPMSAVCEPLAQQDFCNLSHWVLAPLCDVYDRGPELAMYQAEQTIMCVNGLGVSKSEPGMTGTGAAGGGASTTAGAAAVSGSAGAAANACASGAAGACAAPKPSGTAGTQSMPATSGPTSSPASSKGSGCSAVLGTQSRPAFGAVWAALGVLGFAACARRRRCS